MKIFLPNQVNMVPYESDSVLSAGRENNSSVAEPRSKLARNVDASGGV